MISVLIPAYNSAKYLEKCLDSITLQTAKTEFEVLVGVDGCIETLYEAARLMDKYEWLDVFYCEENMGRYIMTNTLIEEKLGNKVIFFDSDDIMMPTLFQEVLDCKEDMMLWKYYSLRNGVVEPVKHNDYAHGVLYMNDKAIKTLGGYQPWRCSADTELLTRSKYSNLTRRLNDKGLMVYRIHKDSLTSTIPMSQRLDYHKLIKKNYGKHEIRIKRITNTGRFILDKSDGNAITKSSSM